MVAIINIHQSIEKALMYNENKITKGYATLIASNGYPADAALLGFTSKMKRFQSLIDHNPNVKKHAVHITLNFSPDDKIADEKFQQIAFDYMEKIGFADQPFLVYRHRDAAHDHLHVVTTSLRMDQKPIFMHNIAKRLSAPARKAIEETYGLIKAEGRRGRNWLDFPIAPFPAIYGEHETKDKIEEIVGAVIKHFKFENLLELNALLRQFRVTGSTGLPGS